MKINISNKNIGLFWCALLTVAFLTNPTDSKDYAAAVLQDSEFKTEAQNLFCAGEPCLTLGTVESDYLQSLILDKTYKRDLFFFTTYEYIQVSPGNPLAIGGGAQAEMLGIFNRFFRHGVASFGFFTIVVIGIFASALCCKDNLQRKS